MHRSLIALMTITLPLAAQQPVQPAPGSMGGSMHLPGQISTSATGEARYTPDRATISLGVQTRAVSAARASADNATKQRAVIDALRAQGIAADQISTENYSLSAIQVFEPNTGDRSPRITGYNVSNTVRVEVKKVEQVGALIDAAIAKGANEVSSLSFHSSAPDSLRRVALADGFRQAEADAKVLAQSAGGRLGELIEVTTAGTGIPVPRPIEFLAAKAASTPIAVGEMSADVAIMARWRFVEGVK
jgi:uncharacterized protein YggE